MKKFFLFTLLSIFVFFNVTAQQIAFPGAEGFGKYAKGARASSSPSVYHVTNLNDTGTGSFRDAVSSSNRIVVFDVAGVIKISSRIVVSSNIYIAGQTAPGEGITIYGNGFSFSGASNTICRYLRIRMGAVGDSGKDACGVANGSNMIFDHVSVAWGRDETFSISGDNPSNITIQNSIIEQGLLSHSAGGLIQTNGGVTLYRNLYVDNDTRNNKIKGVNQYVNNMVYNWSSGAYIMGGDSEGDSYANCESNYFINGPANSGAALGGGNSNYHIYADDNWWDKNRNGSFDGYLVPQSEYSGGPDFQATPYDYPVVPKWSAISLPDSLLPYVGASLPYRDLLDCYVVNEVKSLGKKGKFIANETELSIGIPTAWAFWTGTKRTDSDNDGIPDEWENANGLNSGLSSDALAYASNGYLNIENYINSITPAYSQEYLRAPLNLIADSTTQNNVYLSWFDFTDKETGYCVEQKINGTFTEIARTTKNGNIYTLTGLSPEQIVVLRVRGYNDGGYSGYTNELTVKTKPVPVAYTDLTTFVPELTWSGATDLNWDKTTSNWNNGSGNTTYTENTNALFTTGTSAQTINVAEAVSIGTTVVNSATDYAFSGTGYLTGTGSVNKAGEGKLTLSTENNYTGATVLHNGTLEISKLANGGASSSIGASQNYDFNFVLKGGKVNYTGSSVSTDRNIALEGNADFSVSSSGATVTMNGLIDGTGAFTKSGAGTILFKQTNSYEGTTTINEGTLDYNGVDNINASLASTKSYILNGGKLKTSGGATADYENYYSPIEVADGKTSAFEPYRNCYIYSKFSGNGVLNFNITYVREYVQGDWSQFSGTVYANGVGTTTDGNQFMLNNTVGIPNGRVVTSGNTKIVCWKNASTMYLGGLSGPSGTYLSGADKQNNSATMTWIIGGAGTDETFSGVINNECSNKNYKGTTSIIKEGNGYWKLSNNNIYSGTTIVKDGMLIINGTHSGTGKVTVMEEATLAGKGTIPSLVEVQSGAFIQPGDPAASTLNPGTLNVSSLNLLAGSQCNMEIIRALSATDKVAATGAVIINGTLNLAITGTLQAGDQFTLFTGSTVTGNFTKIIPEKPGENLIWSFVSGVLKVLDESNAINYTDASALNIYPNPAIDFIEISTENQLSSSVVTITDLNGKILFEKKPETESNKIDVSGLQAGIYFVNIKDNNGHISARKFVKM